jgi:hypothetical protein
MAARDGIYDSRREEVLANIDQDELVSARTKFGNDLQIEVRARDAAGNSTTTRVPVPATP